MAKKNAPTSPEQPKTGAERQRAYHQRMRAAGMSRLSVWVPEAGRADFDKAIARLQKRWEKDNLVPTSS